MLILLAIFLLQGFCCASDDKSFLIKPEEILEADTAVRREILGKGACVIAFPEQELFASVGEESETSGGWFSRLRRGVSGWWNRSSWQKRVLWTTLGVSAVGVGVVWINGGYYLVFKGLKDALTYFVGSRAPGVVVSSESGLLLSPTSSEMATAMITGAAGAAASSTLTPTPTPTPTPTQRPPLSAGVCDLVESYPERYIVPEECRWLGTYNGECVVPSGCAYNGDNIFTEYNDLHVMVCRCHRICNAPPKDLPCYRYNVTSDSAESCEHLPLCDTCSTYWCKVCNGWIPEATNMSDPIPSEVDIRAWLNYYGLRGWHWDRSCAPGSA